MIVKEILKLGAEDSEEPKRYSPPHTVSPPTDIY